WAAIALFVLLPAGFPGKGRGAPRWLLSRSAVAWLGLISYVIYLWHLPLVPKIGAAVHDVTGVHLTGAAGTFALFVLAAVAAVACAAASYYLVEGPVLRFKDGFRRGRRSRRGAGRRPRQLAQVARGVDDLRGEQARAVRAAGAFDALPDPGRQRRRREVERRRDDQVARVGDRPERQPCLGEELREVLGRDRRAAPRERGPRSPQQPLRAPHRRVPRAALPDAVEGVRVRIADDGEPARTEDAAQLAKRRRDPDVLEYACRRDRVERRVREGERLELGVHQPLGRLGETLPRNLHHLLGSVDTADGPSAGGELGAEAAGAHSRVEDGSRTAAEQPEHDLHARAQRVPVGTPLVV